MNDLESFYLASAAKVDAAIERIVDDAGLESERLKEAIMWSLFGGGKRFRPALIFATGAALGADASQLVKTAAAVEMIHTYSLIHDDLPAMDDDDLRRGRETCHRKFDEATAILAGDALQVLAFGAIADDPSIEVQCRVEVVSRLAGAAVKMVAGQQLDLESEGEAVEADLVESIHRNKTGALIEFCAYAAAAIARSGDDQRTVVTEFAAHLGLLFQITDDMLDVTRSTEELGKTAGKDISANKATYPSIYGLDGARRMASEAHSNAAKALSRLDADTGLLRAMNDAILARTS